MSINELMAALRDFAYGPAGDPNDPSRWDLGGDFWTYQKYLDTGPPEVSATVLNKIRALQYQSPEPPLWQLPCWPEGKPIPKKPPGWAEWHAKHRIQLTDPDELLRRIRGLPEK